MFMYIYSTHNIIINSSLPFLIFNSERVFIIQTIKYHDTNHSRYKDSSIDDFLTEENRHLEVMSALVLTEALARFFGCTASTVEGI